MLSSTAPPGFMNVIRKTTYSRTTSNPRRPDPYKSASNLARTTTTTIATKRPSPRERRIAAHSNQRKNRRQSIKQAKRDTGINIDLTSSNRDPEDERSDLSKYKTKHRDPTTTHSTSTSTNRTSNNTNNTNTTSKSNNTNSGSTYNHPLVNHFTQQTRDMLSQVRLRVQSRRDGVVQWEPRRLGINYSHIVDKYRLKREEIKDETKEKKEASKKIKRSFDQHRWLINRGHKATQQKKQAHLKRLRQWWDFLDADGGGTLSVDELEDPLVSVGLARGRADVVKLIEMHDTSGEGELSFENFTSMLTAKNSGITSQPTATELHPTKMHTAAGGTPGKGKGNALQHSDQKHHTDRVEHASKEKNSKNAVMQLFDDLEDGKIGQANASLPLQISTFRRQMLLNVHLSPDPMERAKGLMVLNGIIDTKRSQRKDLQMAAAEEEL